MADQLVTVSQIKQVIGGADMRTDGELPNQLNDTVLEMLNGAIARAQENGRKTVRPEDLAGWETEEEPAGLTVASRVRGVVQSAELRVDSSFPDAVNSHVQSLLEEAIQRAQANGRSTVRPHDLATIR
jgi:histone H3/H4